MGTVPVGPRVMMGVSLMYRTTAQPVLDHREKQRVLKIHIILTLENVKLANNPRYSWLKRLFIILEINGPNTKEH